MNIDSILTEWCFRLPKGYPTRPKDYDVLRTVILEMSDIHPVRAEQIVRQAMGDIHEQVESQVPIRIQSMYNNRVIRIQNNNNIMIYSEQPFDDHDFNINNAAASKIASIDVENINGVVNLQSKYNFYKFDTNFKLQKTGETTGNSIIRSVTVESDIFLDSQEFEQFIMTTYSVEGQQIIGLSAMFNAIEQLNDTDKNAVLDLIRKPANLTLQTGVIPIRGAFEILYDIIRDTIKIPNGDWSELWFAIVYDGLVKGAVAGESGIEADIEVGDQTVSLKNYDKITFDFGSLPPEGTQLLNDFLEMAKLLTGQDINKSKGARQINTILDFLDNESVEAQVRQLIKMSETTDIILIQNVGRRLSRFYSLSDNLDKMIHAFCYIIDTTLREKITSVGWWGMIIKSNKTLFLEAANDVFSAVRCKNDRLSPAIANFHQNKLFVLGSQLSTKVTQKPQE